MKTTVKDLIPMICIKDNDELLNEVIQKNTCFGYHCDYEYGENIYESH